MRNDLNDYQVRADVEPACLWSCAKVPNTVKIQRVADIHMSIVIMMKSITLVTTSIAHV